MIAKSRSLLYAIDIQDGCAAIKSRGYVIPCIERNYSVRRSELFVGGAAGLTQIGPQSAVRRKPYLIGKVSGSAKFTYYLPEVITSVGLIQASSVT